MSDTKYLIEVLDGLDAGRKWERFSMVNDRWQLPDDQSRNNLLATVLMGDAYRLAPLPDEITIPARVIPAPLREALKDGDEYYALDLWDSDGVTLVEWGSDRLDFELLADGLVFATREHAIKFRKAMCPYA